MVNLLYKKPTASHSYHAVLDKQQQQQLVASLGQTTQVAPTWRMCPVVLVTILAPGGRKVMGLYFVPWVRRARSAVENRVENVGFWSLQLQFQSCDYLLRALGALSLVCSPEE